jgi:hypothetical protein
VNDLWGQPVVERPPISHGVLRVLGPLHYRKAESPKQSCKTCARHFAHDHARTYHKCELVGCSHGPGTDIRVGWVCDQWKEASHDSK